MLHIKWTGKNSIKKMNIHYLNNGIDTSKFLFNMQHRISIREEFGIQDKFVLGTIGRLSPEKNHMFMVDVLVEMLKIRDDAVLLIVGGLSETHEEYTRHIKLYVEEKGMKNKVIFTGERHDAYRIFNAIDAYLFPSLWEGLGIAAVEAQANGLQVFASNHVPEEVNLTEHIQYLALESGAEEWVKKIVGYNYSNSRKDSCKEIRKRGYDIRDSAKELQEIYINLSKEN